MAGITEDELYRVMYGSIAFEMLHAGSALGVFDHLAAHPGATPAQLGAALGLAPYPCDILVTGLRGIGLVIGDETGLTNAPLTEKCFVHGEDGRHLPFVHDIVNPGMREFLDALRTGENRGLRHFPGSGATLYDRLESDPRLLHLLHDHLRATSDTIIADLVDTGVLANSRHLLDIGGGTGTNAITLARRHPGLRITILDLANVIAAAEENIAAHGLADRIGIRACDVFHEPLPTGADTALLTHMLPIWSPEDCRALLKKVHDALPRGGRVLLFDPLQNDARDGPDYAVLFPAYYLTIASGRGNFYSGATYEQWLRAAGFTGLTRHTGLAVAHGLHVATRD